MSLSRSSKQYLGVRAILPPDLQTATRAPTSADKAYVKGTLWLDTVGSASYMWPGSGDWISLGSGTTGAVVSLTGGSGGAIVPVGGNIDVLGTASQITSVGTAGTITLSLPSAITAPGSLTTTTSLVSGTSIVSGTTIVSGTSLTATTSITATLGNITATNGNLSLATAGNKIIIATGANASVGVSSTMSGTPGAVTVATTACSATAKIFYSRATTGGTPGNVSITAQDGTGFTLTSTGNETSTFNWWIINA